MFSLFNFSSIFTGGQPLTPFAPMCERPWVCRDTQTHRSRYCAAGHVCRYEEARLRAENVWRFETVKTAQMIEDFLRKFIHIDDLSFGGDLGCMFHSRRLLYRDPTCPGREFMEVTV